MKQKTQYKQTPIGLIPQDWEVKTLTEIGKVVTGNTPSRKDLTLWNGDFCWVTAKDFKEKGFTENEKLKLKALQRFMLEEIFVLEMGSLIWRKPTKEHP